MEKVEGLTPLLGIAILNYMWKCFTAKSTSELSPMHALKIAFRQVGSNGQKALFVCHTSLYTLPRPVIRS